MTINPEEALLTKVLQPIQDFGIYMLTSNGYILEAAVGFFVCLFFQVSSHTQTHTPNKTFNLT